MEQWIIDSLKELGVISGRLEERVGIWVTPDSHQSSSYKLKNELKIASIGLRVKNWISYFGVSININPDLNYFNNIVLWSRARLI